MKKILILLASIAAILGLVSCMGCDKAPPKRAYMHNGGGYGMQYHVSIYIPYGQLSHKVQCTKYEYSVIDLYLDDIGVVKGDNIIWKNGDGSDVAFSDNGMTQKNIVVNITINSVIISGLKPSRDNGTYKIETTSPDSWGVPIS